MNSSTRPIVVGIVATEPTALRFAVQEALRAGAGLEIVHAATVPAHDVATYVGVNEFEDIKIAGQLVLDGARTFVEQVASLPPVSYVMAVASAIEALEHTAATAQLLVIGANDVPWYDRMLGDGVAQHMARHAPCPVVVVPEVAHLGSPADGVVVTLDGDTSAVGPLLTYAFEQAGARGHELYILHATAPATLPADAEEIRAEIGEVLARWAQAYPDVRVIRAFIMDGTEQAIAGASEHAGLVVVGRSRSRNLSFALARPLAMQVLRRAGCPVAVIPPDYRAA